MPSEPQATRTVRVERVDETIAVVTIDRPQVRNALDAATVEALHAVFDEFEADESLRAAVLTGAGERAFVSGADIGELLERRRDDAFRRINSGLFRRIECSSVPTVAAVRGWALGGGCELAMACDVRVAGRSARFGQPELSLGILPGAGGTWRLARLVGYGRARELVLTGRIVDAAEALSIGLVQRVVDDDAVLDEALAVARAIAKQSPLAVRIARAAMLAAVEGGAEAWMTLESLGQAILFEDEEKTERMRRFLERRAARRRARSGDSKGGSQR